MKKILHATVIAACLFSSLAHAQRREFERERYRTPHVVYDDRFHHNHYYPAPGYAVGVLPEGHLALTFRGGRRFFYHSGVWYEPGPGGYVVVRPPPGIIVPVLPPAYTTVWIGGAPYYYANDVYYAQAPGGYAVAQPPAEPPSAPMQPPPPGAPPQAAAPASAPSAPGTWFYCDSSKAYYPYVSECKEGWRNVPATPPR